MGRRSVGGFLVLLALLVVQTQHGAASTPHRIGIGAGRDHASDGAVSPVAVAAQCGATSTITPPYLPGVDVSNWQGAINWSKVAGTGQRFAFLKATEGRSYDDPYYSQNRQGAAAHGIVIGAYHFALPSTGSAVAQADHFADTAHVHVGDIVPVLDLERTGGLSTTALIDWTENWLREVKRRTGVKPMIYSGPCRWQAEMGNTTRFAREGYRLWLAHWTTGSPWVPANNWAGHGWTFWQYTSGGQVNGISGRVDMDRFHGTTLTRVRVPRLTVTSNPQGVVTSSPAGITCGADCSSVFNPGSTVALTAKPKTGAVFVRWGGACSGTGSCSVKMLGNKSVAAVFGYTLSASVTGLGFGSVTSAPKGITCGSAGSACSKAYASNTSVTLTASPDSGSQFSGWSGACTGWALTCTVDMTGARSVGASFADDTPPTATIHPPHSLRSPAVATFDEPVHHVSTSDFVIRLAGGLTAVPATVTCDNQRGGRVSCATGDVARALLRPAGLVPGQSYDAKINPPGGSGSVVDRAGNAAPPTTVAFRAATSVEERDLTTGWQWGTVSNRNATDGRYATAGTAGATASLGFSGPSVRWIMVMGPGRGLARVLVDGRSRGVFDLSAATTRFGVGHRFAGLGEGSHTITVAALGRPGAHGPGGTEVPVDGFEVGGTPVPSSSIAYRWAMLRGTAFSGGREAVARERGASLTLRFRGTAIHWITEKGPTGGRARVYLDGVRVRTYDGYSPTRQFQVSRGMGSLTDGVHVLRIVALGTARPAASGTAVWVDAFRIA